MPLVSVIIPVYNVEAYLRCCIDSVLSQSYKNLEVILVDDGSTDSSGKICDNYAALYACVSVYHKENEGLSEARNYGLAKAHGDYINFLDSDDWMEPGMYESLLALICQYDADVAVCNYFVHEGGEVRLNKHHNEDKFVRLLSSVDAVRTMLSFGDFGYMVNTKLYKRKVLDDLSFLKGLLFEDILHTSLAMLNASKVVYTSEPLFNYRVRSNSLSHGNLKNLYDAVKVRDMRYEILSKSHPELISYLKQEYKNSLFYIINQLVADYSLRQSNKTVINKFCQWCKENEVPLDRKETFCLWVYANLPFTHLIYVIYKAWFY